MRTLLEPAPEDDGGFDNAHHKGEHHVGSRGTLLLPLRALSGEAVPTRDDSFVDNTVRQPASMLHAADPRAFSGPPRAEN